ncbi:MAG TPA: OsmC family protein [Longimicrobiales bacterium]|jgi:putative redox protein
MAGKPSEYPIEVVWEGGRRYRGGAPGGPTLLLDGDRQVSPGPVDAVLIALAACSAIDVVQILEKRRTPAASLSVRLDFSRAETPPRRLTEIRVLYRVATEAERHHVERAVELSMEKYCSVATSLAPDIDLTWQVEVQTPEQVPGEAS